MSKRLYLHIGTHKTATTSTQHFFAKNRDAVHQQGIFYPCQSIVNAPRHYAHHRIAHAIAGRDGHMSPEGAQAFFEAVAKNASTEDRIFLSAEPLYRYTLNEEEDGTEQGFANYITKVREMTQDFDVKILVMLRRQDLFAESLYSEHVLSTNYQKGIDRFLEEKRPLMDYASRLGQWGEAFGHENVIVHPFEKESLNVPIERFFVEWLGGEWREDFAEVGSFNTSVAPAFVEFKRQINSKKQSKTANTVLRQWVTKASEQSFTEKLVPRGKYLMAPRLRYALMEQYEADNKAIAEKYLQVDTLFKRTVEADAKAYVDQQELSYEEFCLITKNMLRTLAHQ